MARGETMIQTFARMRARGRFMLVATAIWKTLKVRRKLEPHTSKETGTDKEGKKTADPSGK